MLLLMKLRPFSLSHVSPALDPICNKPLVKAEVTRVSLAEVPKLIAAYNNSGTEGEKKDNKDGKEQEAAAAADMLDGGE